MLGDKDGLKYMLFPKGLGTGLGKQYFAHGVFEWLRLPDDRVPDGLTVAKCTMDPGREWPQHAHIGYEQVLYVVSGAGIHWVNGERRELYPGVVDFLPVGATHRVLNTVKEPLVHVSVYHPIMPLEVRDLAFSVEEPPVEQGMNLDELLSTSSLQSIQDKFAAAVGLGVLMVDAGGKLITKPTGLPEFCHYMRTRPFPSAPCAAFSRQAGEEAHLTGGPTVIACCMGIVCLAVPLRVDDQLAGHMACGFVKLEEPCTKYTEMLEEAAIERELDIEHLKRAYDAIEVAHKPQIVAAAESLESIASAIVSLCVRVAERRRESERNAEMVKRLETVARLERDLKESEFRALQASINPHFLFNALNTIASAISEGIDGSVDMVYALSDFLRSCLRTKKPTTTLRDEITCLENYLRIQDARFGPGLQTQILVDPPEINPVVPSMILQPLVENSISHGLSGRGYAGKVSVAVRQTNGRLFVDVHDNGVGFDNGTILDLPTRDWPERGPGMGLRYVRMKLEHTFGEDYSFVIDSVSGAGTTVSLVMPAWDGGT